MINKYSMVDWLIDGFPFSTDGMANILLALELPFLSQHHQWTSKIIQSTFSEIQKGIYKAPQNGAPTRHYQCIGTRMDVYLPSILQDNMQTS